MVVKFNTTASAPAPKSGGTGLLTGLLIAAVAGTALYLGYKHFTKKEEDKKKA